MAALRAAVFKLFTKNLMGVFKHPPSGARVKQYCMYTKLLCNAQYFVLMSVVNGHLKGTFYLKYYFFV